MRPESVENLELTWQQETWRWEETTQTDTIQLTWPKSLQNALGNCICFLGSETKERHFTELEPLETEIEEL